MLSFLIRIALLFLLFYLAGMILRTILRNLLSPRSGADRRSQEIQGVMMKDPVCGMYVDVRAALTARKKGDDFYFCSEQCRAKFLAADR